LTASKILGIAGIVIYGITAFSVAGAQNSKSCCLGKLPNDRYHIACDTTGRGGMGILQNMRASGITCFPQDYYAIAKRLCEEKKTSVTSWTTNLLEHPTTCAGIKSSK
jgi:hypothetical protein